MALGRAFTNFICVAALAYAVAAGGATTDEADIAIGTKLADLLRAGRSVVSASQPLINDPETGDKGFTGERLLKEAERIYVERVGAPPKDGNLSDRDRRLIEAQMLAMRRVVDEHQSDINHRGVGFKGFIPAVFARLTNEEFGRIVGSEAIVRATAPAELVRNRRVRPDPWEHEVIETRFAAANWPKGQPFTEVVDYGGRQAFRMILPEYYDKSCLTCHGGPKGETDITGYPKEGKREGDLGGAISIVIFR